MTGFAKGQLVRVYPHGCADQAAGATVLIISPNQRSIAVGFLDKPPFANFTRRGVCVHPDHGICLFATREAINGTPWGPWVDVVGGGHFEIEEQDV